MAADVGQRFNGWSYSDMPYNDHNAQDSSVQQMVLDHGSVSFGRFATESLSWEKRSMFEHNSRKEELSKLTAPGLVAQKTAFFEEFYSKRARNLKSQAGPHQIGATTEENDYSTVSEDPIANASSSSFEPSAGIGSSDESNCQGAQELGYLTFNPLFSQAAGLPNIQEEDRSSSGQKHGFSCEAIERKVLAPRHVDPEKSEASKNAPTVNRSRKVSQDLPTSVMNISVDTSLLRRNSENRPSRDLKDPFHKRVEMKLRALSDRMDADRTAASTRSASYQPPERAMTSSRTAYQDRLTISSRSSVCQNTSRALAPTKLAAQASHKYLKGVQPSDAIPHGKGSSASLVASSNSTAPRKSAAKILAMPNSSQVSAKTSRTAQVTLKRAAGPTSVNNVPQNKRKLTLVSLDEKYPKRGYVRRSAPPSARSSSENLPRAAKAPKISNVMNPVSKTEVVQKSRTSSNLFGGRNMLAKRSANCNEENRKVIRSHTGNLPESSTRSNMKGGPSLTKNKPRQERPRWR